MNLFKRTTSIGILALVMSLPVNAGLILGANSVTAPSQSGAALAVNMINQSGLSAAYTSSVTGFDAYVAGTTHNNTCGSNCWANVPMVNFPINLDFSLGDSFTIDSLAMWNYSGSVGAQNFDVYAANNASFTSASFLGSFIASLEGSIVAATGQVFSFKQVAASHVRLALNSNYGDAKQVAIGEVAFELASAQVPEPSIIALFGLGLLGLGFSRRRKHT